MNDTARPRIGITLGDPAGIGPEIVVKALADVALFRDVLPVLYGSPAVLERAMQVVGNPGRIEVIEHPGLAHGEPGVLEICATSDMTSPPPFGKVSAEAGREAGLAVVAAVEAARAGQIDGINTAPLNKEALRLGGYHYPGHTEMLTELFAATGVFTMFVTGRLHIFFLTRHHPLRAVPDLLTTDRVYEGLVRCVGFLRELGFAEPVLALAALNPHGGENGLIGSEEADVLVPAVARAASEGYPVAGPIPADAVFFQALQGRYTGVLSLYHDQGHVAAKTLDFYGTVSVTLGLPVIRTSVDHGTAFDIAGRGLADARGEVAALETAARLIRQRQAQGLQP
ncbi:MAG: 4-hydroxythreonine-4-phosphate dehydrogenase PdxA [Clostridia bacterium]